MALLNGATRRQVEKILVELPRAVTLLVFVRSDAAPGVDDACRQTRELADELAVLSGGKVRTEVYDLDASPGEALLYGIDKAPALVVLGDESGRRDFGIRFYGAPVGYEFSTLIEDMRMASAATTDLAESTRSALSRLTQPLLVQVFVTPSCPYCPRAAFLAHRMALMSDFVTAEVVDAMEFPELAERHHVRGVPRTVVNGTVHIEGAVPESVLMDELAPLIEANTTA